MEYENESIKLLSELDTLVRDLTESSPPSSLSELNRTSSSSSSSSSSDSGGGTFVSDMFVISQIAEALKSNTQRHEIVLEHLDEVQTLVGKLVAHKEDFKTFTLKSNTSFSRYC